MKYDDTYITDLNTPYDYESLMHYEPLSFNKNESVPTITAKIPAFDDIIGQRLDLSAIDLERLNRMYNCSKSEFNHGKQFLWLYCTGEPGRFTSFMSVNSQKLFSDVLEEA